MPLGKYTTFAACVADYIKSGKNEEQARKICGRIQQRIEGGGEGGGGGGKKTKAANQLPASLRAPLERSEKALRFLEESNALVSTSLDSPQSQALSSSTMSSTVGTTEPEQQGESYTDKITRIMDEYGVDEPTAVEVVNRLIKEEQEELDRESLEIQKQIELEKAREQQEQQQEQEQEQQQLNSDNVTTADLVLVSVIPYTGLANNKTVCSTFR
jgi:hypothetical protein